MDSAYEQSPVLSETATTPLKDRRPKIGTVLAVVAGLIVGIIGGYLAYEQMDHGNTQNEIIEFQSALRGYFSRAKQNSVTAITYKSKNYEETVIPLRSVGPEIDPKDYAARGIVPTVQQSQKNDTANSPIACLSFESRSPTFDSGYATASHLTTETNRLEHILAKFRDNNDAIAGAIIFESVCAYNDASGFDYVIIPEASESKAKQLSQQLFQKRIVALVWAATAGGAIVGAIAGMLAMIITTSLLIIIWLFLLQRVREISRAIQGK